MKFFYYEYSFVVCCVMTWRTQACGFHRLSENRCLELPSTYEANSSVIFLSTCQNAGAWDSMVVKALRY